LKIAHIILAHENPHQLDRLVARLTHPDAYFFIHFDLKTGEQDLSSLLANPQVFVVKERIKVYWGGYSIVQATVNTICNAIESGIPFDYINLLSGQDYPLKSTAYIHHFLENNPGKAFMEFYPIATEWTEAIPRLEKYYLTDYPFKGSLQLAAVLNAILPKRKMPNQLVGMGRSQWFTIAMKHAQYVVDYLSNNTRIHNYFRFTWGSDEIVFQTILYNSMYRDDMVNNNLRYIDWSEKKPSPKLLTMNDKDALTFSDKLFARKFNSKKDGSILDYLDSITA
jgi:hypothetical protein